MRRLPPLSVSVGRARNAATAGCGESSGARAAFGARQRFLRYAVTRCISASRRRLRSSTNEERLQCGTCIQLGFLSSKNK